MSTIQRETLKRSVLLAIIGSFKDGVYGNFRLQKVLFYTQKASGISLFDYRRTDLGQYSEEVREYMEQLASIGQIVVTPLPESDRGNRYVLANHSLDEAFRSVLSAFSGAWLAGMDESINQIGYLNWQDLKSVAHEEDLLLRTKMFDYIMKCDIPEQVPIDLPDEAIEELQARLNPSFIAAMSKIVEAVEEYEFDIEQVEKVAALN